MRILVSTILFTLWSLLGEAQNLPALPAKPKPQAAASTGKSLPAPASTPKKQPVRNNTETTRPATTAPEPSFILKILCDTEAILFVDGEKVGVTKAGSIYKLALQKGVYQIKVVSQKNDAFISKDYYKVEKLNEQDLWMVELKNEEDDYVSKNLLALIQRCMLSYYSANRSDDNTISAETIVSADIEQLIVEENYESKYRKSNGFFNISTRSVLKLNDIQDVYIQNGEFSEYSGTSTYLKIVGLTNINRTITNDNKPKKVESETFSTISIPLKQGCSSTFKDELAKLLSSRKIPPVPKGLLCSPIDFFNFISGNCATQLSGIKKDYSIKKEDKKYKYSLQNNTLRVSENKRFFISDTVNAISDYSDEFELDVTSIWDYEIIPKKWSESDVRFHYDFELIIRGNINYSRIGIKEIKSFSPIKIFEMRIPVNRQSLDYLRQNIGVCMRKYK